MCFSAGASFGAAALLGAGGIVTISKAKGPSQFMFASIPLLFSLQQVCEGFHWLSFMHAGYESGRLPAMYLFLIFAQVVWPAWVPLAVLLMERDPQRRKWLRYLSAVGILVAGMLAGRLLVYPVASDIEEHHIRYHIGSPAWMIPVTTVMYLVSTLFSPFVSSLKYMKALGAIMTFALAITMLFYEKYLISVWCFFAAVLSITILYILQSVHDDRSHVRSILQSKINPDKLE